MANWKRKVTYLDEPLPLTCLQVPAVHPNGTSEHNLKADYRAAWAAVRAAEEVLAKCAPHGRDYYVKGDGAWADAHRQHEDRQDRLRAVREELEYLAFATGRAE